MADSVKVKVTADTSDVENRLKALEKKAKNFGSSVTSVFKGMMMSQAVTKGLSLIKSGLESAAQAGMSFEAAMSQVAAISGATGEDLERLEKAARNAGATTKFSATMAANALNYMALAGWDADKSIAALDGVLNLAASSGMDLAQASDMVTDFIAAFGMEAKDAAYMSDMMSYAQSRSNTSAQQLGEAYGNCASSMHSAGQDIETTTAMLEALANQGIKGSEAGTQMAAVMRDLTSKMEKGKIMIGKTAVQVMDAQGNFRDLNAIIADVGKATEGMGTAEASAAIMTTFTARSVKAVQTILNEGIDNVNRYEEELRKSAGTATEQAETMIGNLQGDITIMKSALEGLQITAYDSFSGIARTGVQELTDLINTLAKAGERGGIGSMFDALLNEIPKLIDKVMSGLSGLVEQIVKRLPDFAKKLVDNLPVFMKHLADIVPKLAQGLFEMAGSAIGSLIANLPKLVPQLVSGIWNMLQGVFSGVINGIGSIFNGIGYALSDHSYENIMKGLLEGADKKQVAEIQAAIDADIDTSEVQSEVDTAIEKVREILKGTDLDEDTKEAIVNSVKNSSGIETFRATLLDLGVKEEDLLEAEKQLHHARTRINNALDGLSKGVITAQDAAFNILEDDSLSDEDKIAALMALGIDKAEAIEITQQYKAARLKINDALYQYGIKTPEAQAAAFKILTDDSLTPEQKKAKLIELGIKKDEINDFMAEVSDEIDSISGVLGKLGRDPAKVQRAAFAIMQLTDMTPAAKRKALLDLGIPEADVDSFMTTTDNSITEIQGVLDDIGALGAEERKAILTMLKQRKSAAEVSAALQKLGIPKDVADEAAKNMTSQCNTLYNAIDGITKLDEGQKKAIYELALGGASEAEISAALQKCGLGKAAADKAAKEIKAEADKVSGSLDSVSKLSDDEKQAIFELATGGASEAEIKEALKKAGLGEDAATKGAHEIKTQVNKVGDALAGIGGLGPEQKAQIAKMVADGASKEEISQQLQDWGIGETEANKAADEIVSANETLVDALMTLGLSEPQARALAAGASSDAELIRACLRQLGVPENVIDEIMGSYDSLAGSIAGKLNNLYSSIFTFLTDGKPDTKEEKDKLKKQVEGVIDEVYGNVNKWEQDEVAKLKKKKENGEITESDYLTELNKIKATADNYRTTLKANAQATYDFLDNMAGQSTATCMAQMGDLETYLAEVKRIAGEVELLTGEYGAETVGKLNYDLVTEGKSIDSDRIAVAMQWANDMRDASIVATQSRWAKKREDLLASNAPDEEKKYWDEYYAAEEEAAKAAYDEHMKRIFAGIAQSEYTEGSVHIGKGLNLLTGLQGAIDYLGSDLVDDSNRAEAIEQIESYYAEIAKFIRDYGEDMELDIDLSDYEITFDENGEPVIDFETQTQGFAQGFDEALTKFIDDFLGSELSEDGTFSYTNFPTLASSLVAAMKNGFFDTKDWDEQQYKDFIISLFTLPEPVEAESPKIEISDPEVDIAGDGNENNPLETNGLPSGTTLPVNVKAEPEVTNADEAAADAAGQVKEAAEDGKGKEANVKVDTKAETKLTNPDEVASDMNEQVSEAMETADGEEQTITVKGKAKAEVTEVTTPEDGDSAIEDAVKENLTASVTMDVDAAISLNVSVSDSNAAALGTSAGNELGSAMATELQSKSMGTKLSSATADLMVKVINMANACATLMRSSGANAGAGFAMGLRSKIPQVEAAAKAVAEAAKAAMRLTLDEHSPSRAMKRIGDFAGMGFEIGLTESLDRAVNGAQRIVGALNLNPNTAANGIVNAINGNALDTDALGEAISRRPVVLNVNGREFARATQRDIQITQNNARRRATLGVSGV